METKVTSSGDVLPKLLACLLEKKKVLLELGEETRIVEDAEQLTITLTNGLFVKMAAKAIVQEAIYESQSNA